MLINAESLVKQVAQNINEVNVEQLSQLLATEVCLVDVREPNEYAQSAIAGMVNMPRGLLEFQIANHPKLQDENTPIYLICRSGGRSALAAESLERMGYKSVYSVAGGMMAWENALQ